MADEIIEHMVENWTLSQVEAAKDKVFAAHLEGLQEAVLITGTSFGGSSSSGQLSVAPGARERFLSQCRTAIRRLKGENATSSHGIAITFANRRIES